MIYSDIYYNVEINDDGNGNISAFFDFYVKPPITNKKNMHVSHMSSYKKVKDDKGDCSVCLEMIKKGQYYRQLDNCFHYFHKKCIDKWFKINYDMTCPICRCSYLQKND